MRYSELFGKTQKQIPREAETISHRLLIQAGFIDHQLTSGVYSFLPLGVRVLDNIANIIREEIEQIGGQEVLLPTLQPKELWKRSDRWDHMDPPLFKLKDRHEKELALGSTHEEVITDLVSRYVKSYKDLPRYLYQIQNKFRNEYRSAGGLLRVREFLMKDLYSFHSSADDLDEYYHRVIEAYKNIFNRCGFHAKVVEANSGTIGGSESHEFMMICQSGEDKIVCCRNCDWAANVQKNDVEKCPSCGGEVKVFNAIENGHTFKLGLKYSEPLNASFIDRGGNKKPIFMGCYGIGLGRLMATIVEDHSDKKGIIWPVEVSPFDVHFINLRLGHGEEEFYENLIKQGLSVLWDDREDTNIGEKFVDADLIGIPVRLVVSESTGDLYEYKRREGEETELLSAEQVVYRIKEEIIK